ncbi:MAG: hypothetical protein Rubg2KO_31770 [Rubricoccaceae bacterium]
MRSEFDPLRSAPLPDSFERTAEWLREAPPPPRTRRAPATTLVALLLIIGACSWPVSTTVAAGSVIEILSADRIGVGHPTLVALDRLIPDEHQHLVEVAGVGEEGSEGTVLRYAVLGADDKTVERWKDSVAALPGTEAARVIKLDVRGRRPFGVVTVQRVFGVSSTPHLSDAELQMELDRVFSDATPITITVRRVDGQRMLNLGDHVTVKVRPGTRVSRVPTPDSSTTGILIEGTEPNDATIDGRPIGRPERGSVSFSGKRSVEMALDSLPPEVAREIRDRLNANLLHVDSLRTTLPPGVQADTLSQFYFYMRSDTLRRPLPPGTRIDTVRRFIRIQTLRDSL